jgi:nucleotide-binding universal stress UspA family protein
MFRSLLLAVDLSKHSDGVLQRAARLHLSDGARLALLHVVPKLLRPASRLRAEMDAKEALSRLAKQLSRELPKSARVECMVKVGAPATEISRQARSGRAQLILIGRGSGRALRDALLGSTAERVVRSTGLPVLLVRVPPRSDYRRPVLAIDLDQAADDVVSMMLRLIPEPRPPVVLVHAYDVPFVGLFYPSLTPQEAQRYSDHHRMLALEQIARVQSAHGKEVSWKLHLRKGSARTVIGRALTETRADLLALGTHGYSGIAHVMLGTVAGDVLRAARCDVLVVPPARRRGRSGRPRSR